MIDWTRCAEVESVSGRCSGQPVVKGTRPGKSRFVGKISFGKSERPLAKILAAGAPRIALFTRAQAVIEELAFHRVARQSERCTEVLACALVPSTAKLELAKCRGVERICGEAITVGDRADLFEPALGTLGLCDRNGAVECNDWGRTYSHQPIVE
jgi:hypothetical protein